jgi:chromosome segregation ATPase
MCGNRVEELEEQVNQLQATVDGLTDELVECKVRIRELENAVDDDNGFSPDNPESEHEVEDTGPTPAEEANTEEPEPSDEEQAESESDIIIA